MTSKIQDQPDPNALIVAHDRLVPWRLNPRKTIEGIDELAASIKEKGILTSLLVREGPDGRFEIIAGERRWLAAAEIGLSLIPIRIRHDLANDDDALEAAVVDNIQRVDVHPLEEADCFAALRSRGRDVEDIAAGVGRSTSHVYRRLLLTGLCEAGRQAFTAGQLTTGAAEQLARVADPELQTTVLESALRTGGGQMVDEPVSVRSIRLALDWKLLDLKKAKWELTDAKLVPAAGACSSCPKRTGAQAQLFGEAEADDRCTDPKCWGDKREAYAKVQLKRAKKAGHKVLNAAEATELYPQEYSARDAYGLKERGYYDLDHASYGQGPWREVLEGHELPITVARDPHSGEVHELVRVEDVEPLLKTLEEDAEPGKPTPRPSKRNAEELKQERIWQAKQEAGARVLGELVKKVEAGEVSTADALRFIAEAALGYGDAGYVAARRRGLLPEDAPRWGVGGANASTEALAPYIAKTERIEDLVALCLELLISEDFPIEIIGAEPSVGQRAVEHAGIDWLAIEKEAVEAVTAAAEEAPKASKKKRSKKASKAEPAE